MHKCIAYVLSMKNLLLFVLLIFFLLPVTGQRNQNFSRGYVGIEAGVPLLFGDFRSVTSSATALGLHYGIFGGYQLSPWLGLEVSLQQGKAKSYSPGFAEENFIGEDGMTYYYLYPGTLEKWRYGEVYSSTSFQTFGFQVNFTVNNLFGENWGTRRWTVLLSPAVYLQRFSSSIYRKTDEVKLTDGASSPDMNLGAGLNLSLRYKINEHIDLQLRTGGMWVNNTAFEGVTTVIRTKGNGLWTTGLSVIWNINRRQHKGGNLLYAPTSPYKNRIRTRTWRCM